MTINEFAALCEKYTIDPAIALESEAIQKALADKQDSEVERILREEF